MKKDIWLYGTLTVLLLGAFLAGCARENARVVYDTQAPVSASAGVHAQSEAAVSGSAVSGTAPEDPELVVHVCGEVRHPGVYVLPAGSRVYQALEAAGGLTGKADGRALNQAELLSDGEQILVRSLEETAAASAAGVPGGGQAADGRINLNTATKEALLTLPGIGEARAAAILAYREEHGGFSSPEELMQIDGIGEKSYSRLKEKITV